MPRSMSGNTSVAAGHPSRTLLFLLVAAAMLGAALGAYMVRETILNGLDQMREGIMTSVGLGFAPITLLVGAFALVLLFKRSWLGPLNLWLAAVALVLAVSGALSFFRPFDGALGWFSGYGYSTLGGSVGDAVIGSPNWLGAVRMSALFVLAIAIALPTFAVDVGRLAAQGLLLGYLTAFMGVRSLFSRRRPTEPEELPVEESPLETSLSFDEYRSDLAPRTMWDEERDEDVDGADSTMPKVTSHLGADDDWESQRSTRFVFTVPDDSTYSNSDSDTDTSRTTHDDFSDLPEPALQPARAAVGDDALSEDARRFGDQIEQEPIVPQDTEPDWPDHGSNPNPSWNPIAEPEIIPAAAVEDSPPPSPPSRGLLSRLTGSGLMWQRPGIEMLRQAPEMPISTTELKDTAETITQTLGEYGVEVEVGHVRPGPTVTMYGLVPGWIRRTRVVKPVDKDGLPLRDESGRQITKREEQKTRVKVDSILAREKDLALALRTQSIRIETPAMGKSLVGIEVPNPNPSLVTLRNVMESREFQKLRKDAHLPVALGRGSGGEAVCFDLAKMPHLLVAGATGSGKSVCLNAIVSCLITEKTPVEARLLLVDPKRVELTPYNGVPHLMAPVIVETDTVVGFLKGLIREMFGRYRMMEEKGVRNIEAYNKRTKDHMPYLCVVIDELADLMMTAAFDVEQSLCRLAQLGRATGIHLIIATQRPSVDVVTGLIKANFPSRISFGVTSQVDSRTILDTAGADKLLGRGDMLYLPLDASKPSRVQSVFIGDEEIGDIVGFWKKSPWPPLREIDLLGVEEFDEDGGEEADDVPDRDDMFNKALELAQTHRKLSTSLLQRRLRVGYPRAARLMDQLEEEGVVGPGDGSKSRDVIINQA